MAMTEMNQVHSDAIVEITTTNAPTPTADAIWTRLSNVAIAVRTADCLPILFAIGGLNSVVGGVHAGRTSTELGITRSVFETLSDEGISGPIHVWFGPCICESCYQVDRTTDAHYDLIGQNRAQLQSALPDGFSLTLSGICTSCENNRFFSFRKEGEAAGRFYSVIGRGSNRAVSL